MQRNNAYSQTDQIGGASPRETEILAFGLCNARLKKAADPAARIDALNKTHQLWSILVRDLSGDGNNLPVDVKSGLIDLGFWAMGYSISAICKNLPVQPLIDVNQNVLEGLRGQMANLDRTAPSNTAKFIAARA